MYKLQFNSKLTFDVRIASFSSVCRNFFDEHDFFNKFYIIKYIFPVFVFNKLCLYHHPTKMKKKIQSPGLILAQLMQLAQPN